MKTPVKFQKRAVQFLMIVALCFSVSLYAQDAKVIELKGTDAMKFSKTDITAKAGQKVTIKLTTVSKLPGSAMSHNFVLLKQSADAKEVAKTSAKFKDNNYIAPDMENKIIAHTDMASGGETVKITFTVPEKSGDYPYVCTFPGHFLAGMKGTLKVQ